MERVIDTCLNIIKVNDLMIDTSELDKLKSNYDSFFNYLFRTLDNKNLEIFIIDSFKIKELVPILFNYFYYISVRISPDICTYLFKYLIENGINPYQLLNSINVNTNSLEQYKRIASYLKENIIPYSKQFEKENKVLYDLNDKINDIYGDFQSNLFEKFIILPLSRENGNEYLKYMFRRLNFNVKGIEVLGDGIGTYSWCFKLGNDLVLRFSQKNTTWNIPMFYRINDFVIRRCFDKTVVSVCPRGNINDVTNEDIDDALFDFTQNDLVLTDGNYASNFAVVDYEIPSSMFTDVCGITKHLNVNESDTFKKKKVKLIDQDYIYFKNQEPKHYGSIPTYK